MNDKIVKRLEREKIDNEKPGEGFYAQPTKDCRHKWHFTLKGVPGTPYEGGLYHGLLDLGPNYPLEPPNIYFHNHSGRYEPNVKICLNITSYHKETWSPIWNVQKMMEALCAYFVCDEGGIGSVVKTPAERKTIAKSSRTYKCDECGPLVDIERIILSGKSLKEIGPPVKQEPVKEEPPKAEKKTKGKRVKKE